MKVRYAQSDLRKIPDSPRVHGLRLSVNSPTALVDDAHNSSDRVDPHSSSTVIDHKREGPQADKNDGGFEPLLDVSEAAKLLRIHPKTLRVKARRGVIPAIQIGRVWRFRASALNRWLDEIAG
jgi:excisionase family DNA binding protein